MSNPLEFNGVIFPNITRRNEAQRAAEDRIARDEWLAAHPEYTKVPDDVAHGLQRSKYIPRKGGNGKTAAPLISTGDPKYDMYLNALPGPVRDVVIRDALDPRALYKEYRLIKKAGMIAKYAPESV